MDDGAPLDSMACISEINTFLHSLLKCHTAKCEEARLPAHRVDRHVQRNLHGRDQDTKRDECADDPDEGGKQHGVRLSSEPIMLRPL